MILSLKKIPVVGILTLNLKEQNPCGRNFDFEFEKNPCGMDFDFEFEKNPCGVDFDFAFEGKKSMWREF